ncbi:MAG: macro domain-containing protein [Planctomycetota bacterium]
MNYEIVEGDLLEQDVDAIVNSWNRNFIPWWLLLPQGVSGAIKRRAGLTPFRELGRFGPMKLGDAVLTSAGRLPLRGIIHVASLEWYWVPTRDGVRRGVYEAIRIAKQAGYQTLAFPVLGSGTGGMKVDDAIAVMREGLENVDDDLHVRVVKYRKDR